MPTLVTGATGTVGSAVVARLLRDGITVRGLARSAAAAPLVRGDLEDPASLQRALAGVDHVVHCAAELSDDLALCTRTNVDGTRNLLLAMATAGVHSLVHVSTVSVYDYRQGLDITEDSPLWTEPANAYGYTKAEAERLVLEAGIASIVRPVAVISMHPRAYWGPLALARAAASSGPIVPVAEFPYVHVDNLVDAIVRAATAPRGRAYNVIDGAGPTPAYLAAVSTALGRPVPSLPPDAPVVRYAGSRIRAELGYAPPDRWQEFLDQLSRDADPGTPRDARGADAGSAHGLS